MTDDITVQPLVGDDWKAFRDLRLAALRAEPHAFGSSYECEAGFDEDQWRARLTGPRKQMFGLFDGEILVGITGIIPDPDDETTAMFVASYISPPYRGYGFSDRLFQARIAFALAAKFIRITVAHRESNERSYRAIRRHGFIEISRTPQLWPDGVTEDEVVYELQKNPPSAS